MQKTQMTEKEIAEKFAANIEDEFRKTGIYRISILENRIILLEDKIRKLENRFCFFNAVAAIHCLMILFELIHRLAR